MAIFADPVAERLNKALAAADLDKTWEHAWEHEGRDLRGRFAPGTGALGATAAWHPHGDDHLKAPAEAAPKPSEPKFLSAQRIMERFPAPKADEDPGVAHHMLQKQLDALRHELDKIRGEEREAERELHRSESRSSLDKHKAELELQEARKGRKVFAWHMGWVIAGAIVAGLGIQFGFSPLIGLVVATTPQLGLEITDRIKHLG